LTEVCALIPAAGRGVRFGGSENKVFAPLLGRPLLGWTLQAFADSSVVDSIILIGAEEDLPRLREIGRRYGGGKFRDAVEGGASRQESVRYGLSAVGGARWVVIHDGARPCVTPQLIADCLHEARRHNAAYAALPLVDTLVRSGDPDAAQPVPRDDLWVVQTPQAFGVTALRAAHLRAVEQGWTANDDAGLINLMGQPARRVAGSPENLKVTHAEDLVLAEAILSRRPTSLAEPLTPMPGPEYIAPIIRIGQGYDVHVLASGRKLFLGGVEFPDAIRGLLGHSDADVLLHALCDALLGAAGMGDIGILFPPSDDRHKDRPSLEFLADVKQRLDIARWRVGNVDITVLAESPRIGPRVGEMKENIAQVLEIPRDAVGIKATTNEGLGFIGRREGIAAHATALLLRA
jgi:2-C-methyl-D-erythritol 4-phosphate cytidylyltransferase/2-C-methyl-D-erythritol 2,4-cyclodiphosphate synthase